MLELIDEEVAGLQGSGRSLRDPRRPHAGLCPLDIFGRHETSDTLSRGREEERLAEQSRGIDRYPVGTMLLQNRLRSPAARVFDDIIANEPR